jgi:hypothetical protein
LGLVEEKNDRATMKESAGSNVELIEKEVERRSGISEKKKDLTSARCYDHLSQDGTKIFRIIKGDTTETFVKGSDGTFWGKEKN